jgi:outer membrane protein TolC
MLKKIKIYQINRVKIANLNFAFILLTAFFLLDLTKNSFAENKISVNNHNVFLSEKKVISSAAKHYPAILANYEKVEAAKSEILAAKGFFDVRLKQNYFNQTRGFYDGSFSDTQIEKELGYLGSKVYGGYRKSFDDFADYNNQLETANRGEYKAGVKFSLLKNRDIDQNRLSVMLADLGFQEAKIELENIQREIIRDAKKAYWNWATSGKILKIYQSLLNLAMDRQKQFEARIARGDLAEIVAIENKKNILRIQNSLTRIHQDFENSAVFLSLFYRDEKSSPIIADESNLPDFKTNIEEIKNAQVESDITLATINRPEIKIIKIKKDEELKKLDFAKNLKQPQLDVDFGVSKDRGNGDISKTQSANFAQIDFSVPLQFREARGKIAESEKKLSAIKFEQKLIEEKIRNEILQIKNRIIAINKIHKNLVEEVRLTEILETAERERFKQGASNLFLVNEREQEAAQSKASLLEIYRDFKIIMANYEFAIFTDL